MEIEDKLYRNSEGWAHSEKGRKHGPTHLKRDLQIENSQKMTTQIVAGVGIGQVETKYCHRISNS